MKKKVLIVDDSKTTRQTIRKYLTGMSCVVDEAEDGEMAFDYCMMKTPDIILLDDDMPNLCGMAFLRLYRDTLGQHKKLPAVIFCVENAAEEYIQEARELGVKEFITSPIAENVIKKTMGKVGVL